MGGIVSGALRRAEQTHGEQSGEGTRGRRCTVWRALRLEFVKLRGRALWLLPFLALVLQSAWLWGSMRDMRHAEIVQGWQVYLYHQGTLSTLLLPLLAALLASRAAELEHKGEMQRCLYLAQSPQSLFAAKLGVGAWYLGWFFIGRLLVMLAIGAYKGFYGPVPWGRIGCDLLFCFTATFTVYLMQLLVALLVRNQAAGLLLGAAGSFYGLASLFLPQTYIARLLPWSYYRQLSVCGMSWDAASRRSELFWTAPAWDAYLCLLVWLVLAFVLGCRMLARRDY